MPTKTISNHPDRRVSFTLQAFLHLGHLSLVIEHQMSFLGMNFQISLPAAEGDISNSSYKFKYIRGLDSSLLKKLKDHSSPIDGCNYFIVCLQALLSSQVDHEMHRIAAVYFQVFPDIQMLRIQHLEANQLRIR
jgi:hypothetical protein